VIESPADEPGGKEPHPSDLRRTRSPTKNGRCDVRIVVDRLHRAPRSEIADLRGERRHERRQPWVFAAAVELRPAGDV
jgi:hypothetical protein